MVSEVSWEMSWPTMKAHWLKERPTLSFQSNVSTLMLDVSTFQRGKAQVQEERREFVEECGSVLAHSQR
jgi:hypothetical protein